MNPFGSPLVLAFLAVFWVVALAVPAYRTMRFLCLMAAFTIGAIVAGSLTGRARDAIDLAVVVAATASVVFAERLRIGALRQAEQHLVDEIDRGIRAADGGASAAGVAAVDRALATPTDVAWRPALRLLRRAWSPPALDQVGGFLSPTPTASYAIVGRRFLHDARTRRVLGVRRRVGRAEESIALRAYLDEVRTSMPGGVIGAEPGSDHDWVVAARALVDELRSLPLRAAGEVRDRLVDLLGLEIDMRISGGTAADQAMYDQRAAALESAWARLDHGT